MFKRVLTLALLGAFSVGMIGCHVSGDVDPDGTSSTDNNSSSYSKKTTEVKSNDGSYQKTETKTEKNP